jgi:23S rRNA (pseudouridine1915-N3)-methyltransferase
MKVTLLLHGRTDERFIQEALDFYIQRLKHYMPVQVIELPSPKVPAGTRQDLVKEKEAALTMKHVIPGDHVVLLDERGKQFTSIDFSSWLQAKMNAGIKHLVMITGGPYGFDATIRKRANESISLSKMTFTHQMTRVILAEQLYRACTILRNESYHHE